MWKFRIMEIKGNFSVLNPKMFKRRLKLIKTYFLVLSHGQNIDIEN